jgi:hypothetical protein
MAAGLRGAAERRIAASWVMRSVLLLLFAAVACAGEAVVAPEPVWLGLEVEAAEGEPPLRIATVTPGASADRIGLRPGDRLRRLGDAPVPTLEALAAAIATLRAAGPLAATVVRDGRDVELNGSVEAVPRPRQLLTDAAQLRGDIARLREDRERDSLTADLQASLLLLNRLQDGLPRLAERFKQVYPQGTFAVQIHIDIRSDPANPQQDALPPAPAPKESTAP